MQTGGTRLWLFSGPDQTFTDLKFKKNVDPNIEKQIKKILSENNCPERYEIMCSDDAGWGSSSAYEKNPVVLYSVESFAKLKRTLTPREYEVTVRSIYLHEMRHLENWDAVSRDEKCQLCEEYADGHVGFQFASLFKANGEVSLKEIANVYSLLVPPNGTPGAYKNLDGRLKDVSDGYERASRSASQASILRHLENSANAELLDIRSYDEGKAVRTLPKYPLEIFRSDSVVFNRPGNVQFNILFNSGLYFLAVTQPRAETHVALGVLQKSRDERYGYQIVDENYYYWYMSRFGTIPSRSSGLNTLPRTGYIIYASNKDTQMGVIYARSPIMPF